MAAGRIARPTFAVMAIRKLTPDIHDKVWGSPLTEPWFPNPEGRKVGEVWLAAPGSMPVLIKFLFTSEHLSVQVHPDDAWAQSHGEIRGKTEVWHILRAEPDASIALGLKEPVTRERLRAAALNGEIVDLLQSFPVKAGDTFFVPAGTIHAIGGGLAICEIQQFSDVTYRLFDFHRQPERPLHMDEALAVSRLTPADGRRRAMQLGEGRELLAECEYFRAERLKVNGTAERPAPNRPVIYVTVAGEGTIAGEAFRAGDAFLAPGGTSAFRIESADAAFVIASIP